MSEVINTVAGAATAVGVLFAGYELRQTQLGQKAAFEQGFAQRYQHIADRLPNSVLLDGEPCTDDEELRVFYEYFELCEEECYYRARGRISRRIWRDWWEGIDLHLRSRAFQEAYDTLSKRHADATNARVLRATRFQFTENAIAHVNNHEFYDPKEGWWPWG